MSWVFQSSRSRGVDRLVLLAIADSANDHGAEAWPSLSTIAAKAGVDRRTVSRSLTRLVELGELERLRSGGISARGGVSNSYRVVFDYPQKQGQSAPRGGKSLGAERPEVGAESPGSRGAAPHYPSRTTLNHPRPDNELSTEADFPKNVATARKIKEQFRSGGLHAVAEPRDGRETVA